MTLIYLAHPFGGDNKNIEDAARIIKDIVKQAKNISIYSPLHATGFLYDEMTYEDGMEHCYEALSRCDALWLCDKWESSRGCKLEVKFAKKNKIPIRLLKFDGNKYYTEEMKPARKRAC